MGRDGASACTIRSQASQLSFGRTWRITLKYARTYYSISAVSSPSSRILPPQSGQASWSSFVLAHDLAEYELMDWIREAV
jgi:hypothetical protein